MKSKLLLCMWQKNKMPVGRTDCQQIRRRCRSVSLNF